MQCEQIMLEEVVNQQLQYDQPRTDYINYEYLTLGCQAGSHPVGSDHVQILQIWAQYACLQTP